MASNSEEGEVVSKPRVSIRALSGRTCHFDVGADTTVEQLKRIIAGDMEVSVERQRLLFQGKMLLDGQLLKEIGCFNKVIHLVKRAEPPATSAPPPPPVLPAPSAPETSGTSGVIFPFLGPQMLNNMWAMGQPPAAAAPASSAPPPGATPPPPLPNPRANRSVPGILWETRRLLQLCEGLLDKFDRGEAINPQDLTQPSDPGPGPSVSVASSLLGDLCLQMVGVYSRLSPHLREQARFLQEDRELGEEARAEQERVSSCIRAVLERLHVCEVHLLSLSVPPSQAPPRTVQTASRGRRRVVIQTPHMAHVQVSINQSNVPQPPVPPPATADNSDGAVPPPPPPNPPTQPLLAPSPAELTNIFVQAISSMIPGAQVPDGVSAVPHTITGEAVFIQNGVVNNIPFGTGAGPLPPLLPLGIPQDQTIVQLARLMYPGFVEESGEDVYSRLLLLLCSLVTVEQMRDIGQGRVECLQAMYPRVREFVVRELVPEGAGSGEGERESAGRRLAESTVDNIEGLLEALPAQEGLNLKETFICFFQAHFKKAIALILDPRNEDIQASNTENRFGKVIWGWSHTLLCELFQLVDVLSKAGSADLHSVLEGFLRNFIQTNGGGGEIPMDLVQVLLRENREKINSIIRSSHLTEQQIKDKYIIHFPPEPCPLPELVAAPDWVPQEWKQCIEEDQTEIQNSSQTSFSNSYMAFSGLTDGKGQNVTCSGEDMLCDTLKMSISSSQAHTNTSVDEVIHDVRQNSTLKKRYNEFIDSNLNKRVRSDPNYTPERFPNSAVRFKPDES